MSAPDEGRIERARKRAAEVRAQQEAKPMRPWDVQRLAVRDSFRIDDLIEAHDRLGKSVREFVATRYLRTEGDARDLMRAVDILGLYARWQRERIDRLERLLVASGAIAAPDVPAIGGFTGEAARHDLVALVETNEAAVDAMFDMVDEYARAMGG